MALAWFVQGNRKGPTPTPEVVTSTDTPSEEVVVATDYPFPPLPTESQRLVVPSIGVDGYIQRVGIDQYKNIAVPTNVHLAGWFTQSVVPGEKGLSIIDGHVNGRKGAGIFSKLAQVSKGDEITITLANGTARVFEVVSVTTIPTEEAANSLFSQDPAIERQLNLITCSGIYERASKDFTHRTIVAARLKKS
ncbi:MAG TPA: class F sortase [Verrucomicrobiae bacterium]|nr:class F sortase [Verrucomicrobiae bacterium]